MVLNQLAMVTLLRYPREIMIQQFRMSRGPNLLWRILIGVGAPFPLKNGWTCGSWTLLFLFFLLLLWRFVPKVQYFSMFCSQGGGGDLRMVSSSFIDISNPQIPNLLLIRTNPTYCRNWRHLGPYSISQNSKPSHTSAYNMKRIMIFQSESQGGGYSLKFGCSSFTPHKNPKLPLPRPASWQLPWSSLRPQASYKCFEYSAHTYQVKRKGARLPTHQVKSFFLPEVEMRSHEIGNPTLSSVIRIWMMGCHTDGYLVQCSLLRWVVSFAFFQKDSWNSRESTPRL